MSASLLKGAPVAAALYEKGAADCAVLAEKGITPCLATLRVGKREDDIAYENGLTRSCAAHGIDLRKNVYPANVEEQVLLERLEGLNSSENIHGILIFLPLLKHLNAEHLRRAIAPEKDVDGIGFGSMAGLMADNGMGFSPCTAQAVLEMLRFYKIPTAGKHAVVLGRSLVVGKPASLLLLRADATVTVCHSKSTDAPQQSRRADILIVASGKAEAIDQKYLAPGQVVIDAGIHSNAAGHLCGDVKAEDADRIVASRAPVPGGLGSVTSAVLVQHVIQSALRSVGLD